jgi:hypothetical protein
MSAQRASSSDDLGRRRVVPLEAGAGPENPPCPACGEPLFGWIDARGGLDGPAKRCESCGLGVVGEPEGAEEALTALDRLGAGGGPRIANRGGLSASLGGAGWAGLQPGIRYLFTPEAVRRLVANRDQVVTGVRWSPRASIAAMWQTLLNSATFGHNVVVGSAAPAQRRWQRRIDWLTTVVLALPALILALALELAGAAVRRGSVVSLRLKLL